MTDQRQSLAPGLLVLMLGVFLISRSVTKDDTGRTLIDRVLGKPGTTPAAAAAAVGGSGIVSDTTAPLPVHDLPHGAPGATVRRPLPRHQATPRATAGLAHGAAGAQVRR